MKVVLLCICFVSRFAVAFVPPLAPSGPRGKPFSKISRSSSESDDDSHDENANLLSTTSKLSHVMLKVTSVDDAVSYWTKKGSIVPNSRKDEEGDSYRSAFVALGNGRTTEDAFSLELVKTDNYQLGNVINYLGVSLLLQFQGNLEGLISGQTKARAADPEPHGIPVKSCAASPGDFFCRLCLKSNNLQTTQDFYQDLLGMQVAAADDSQLCVRYENDFSASQEYGVPTALVFEGTNEKLHHGTCLDHLAIVTTMSINELHGRLTTTTTTTANATKVFMKPTEMFGKTVMGILDPNGYKIVLAGPA